MAIIPGSTGSPTTFDGGFIGSPRANVETITATKVLTSASNRVQILTPSGATRAVQFPTTGILQGEGWRVANAAGSGQALQVLASNGAVISTLQSGEALDFSSLVAAPVANTDWAVQIQPLTLADGTVSTPALRFTGAGADTGIYSPGTDQIAFAQNGVQTLQSSSAGAFSIGPAAGIEASHTLRARNILVPGAAGSTTSGLNFGASGGGYSGITHNAAHTSGAATYTRLGADTVSVLLFGQGVGGAAGDFFSFYGSASAAAGSLTLTSSNLLGRVDSGGTWTFQGGSTVNERLVLERGSADGTQKAYVGWDRLAAVRTAVTLASGGIQTFSFMQYGSDGSRAAGSYDGSTQWVLGVNNTTTKNHYMHIGASGVFGITTTDASNTAFTWLGFYRNGNPGTGADFCGGLVSNIPNRTTSVNSGPSDRRVKTNVEQFDALSLIDLVTPVSYERTYNLGHRENGFIAQELYEACPQAVFVGGEDPETNPWCVDYARVTPILWKAIRELKTSLDEAKSEIALLKAGN